MKIKAVCEQTGLTDRTVRYYIEQGLLSPAFHENYLGRKQFDFTGEDVQRLKNIALLRSFDFTIREIQELIEHPEHSGRILLQVRTRKEKEIEKGQNEVKTLSGLSLSRPYTLDEMATALRMTEFNPAITVEKPPRDLAKTLRDFAMSVFVFTMTWTPVGVALLVILKALFSNRYPHINLIALLLTAFFLTPTWIILLLPKVKRNKWKPFTIRLCQSVLLFCCIGSILWVLIASPFVVDFSSTTDLDNYGIFDTDSVAQWSAIRRKVFPVIPQETAMHVPKPIYRYYHSWDADEVFLECKLYDWNFDAEVQRVVGILNNYRESPENIYDGYIEGEMGSYCYKALYFGEKPFLPGDIDASSGACLFAYNVETHIVRYVWFIDYNDPTYLLESLYSPHFTTVDW